MKTRLVIFGAIGILFFIGLKTFNNRMKKKYVTSFLELQNTKSIGLGYEQYFKRYYSYYNEFPSLRQSDLLSIADSMFYSDINDDLLDHMSRQGKQIYFIPLYQKHSNKRIGGLLLSAGIDGKINNIVGQYDTIYINDFSNKIELYNQYIDSSNVYSYDSNFTFSLYKYFFGQKDYLYKYMDGEYDYKMSSWRSNLVELINYLGSRKYISNKFYCYKGTIEKSFEIDSIQYVYMKQDDIVLINKIKKYNKIQSKKGDSICLVGTFDTLDHVNKVVKFYDCIAVPLDFKTLAKLPIFD